LTAASAKGNFVVVNFSKLDHGKTGNQSKVSDIQSCDSIAKMQRRGTNEQIFESNAYAAGCLLALYFPSELSDFECYWMAVRSRHSSSVKARLRSR
jgi:hypothetical protein